MGSYAVSPAPASHRRAARIAGSLLIAGVVTSLAGTALLGGSLDADNVISALAQQENRVLGSVVLQLLTAVGAAGIAIAFYPVLKDRHPALAVGAVAFRSIEAVFSALAGLALLVLLGLADHSDTAALADATLTAREAALYVIGVFLYCGAATMYYLGFYRSRLLPRPLVLWGAFGVALIFVTALVTLLDGAPYAIEGRVALLAVPIASQEVLLGLWLIVRGFRTGRRSDPAATA